MDLTAQWPGIASLCIFFFAYTFVVTEEFTHLRKSKPVMLSAGLIWGVIGVYYAQIGQGEVLDEAVRDYLGEFAELFMFLLAAMTYVNSMSDRNVFEALRSRLIAHKLSYRQMFWVSGVLSFFLSALIDNLTTSLVMCAVILAVGRDSPRFMAVGCVNIVVAANAGGAFSPFGDITTLMVWQKGIVEFTQFFALFVPSVVNYVVPAVFMAMAVPHDRPDSEEAPVSMSRGALGVLALFGVTIVTAVSFHNFLHLPSFMGMITGLALLKLYGYYLRHTHPTIPHHELEPETTGDVLPFESFVDIARAEWDTLLFFFGVIMSVGGLSFLGYLSHMSGYFYLELGPTTANVLVGILSAIVDNIPVMVAVLQMTPDMELQQWLLVTLTAGVGGSMLSIGSAAGVALMGRARGHYTFFSHLRWTPVIALGYALSIMTHLWIGGRGLPG